MKRVLMVCLGNICRSPMAQGVLEKKAAERSIDLHIDSAGTASYHIGEPPDNRAIAKTGQYDIDISHYRGRQFGVEDYDEFDIIFAMDYSNYQNIISLARHEEDKAKVEMILNLVYPGENMSVPDPYYGGDQGFENVYQLLDQACERFLNDHEG